jgi:hypothetical protein
MPYAHEPWTHGGERLPAPPQSPLWTEEELDALLELFNALESAQSCAAADELDGRVEPERSAIAKALGRIEKLIADAEEHLGEEEYFEDDR